MQLVFISQYPPKEEVTFTPATSLPTCVLPAASGGAPSLLPRTDEVAAHCALNIPDLALPLAAFGGR